MSPEIAHVVGRYCTRVWHPVALNHVMLTPREKEVLVGLSNGCTYAEIATILGVKIDTVRFYVKRIYRKLEAKSQGEAVAKGIRMGLLSSDCRCDERTRPETDATHI